MKIIFLPSSRADVRWFTRYYQNVFPTGAPRARAWLERSLMLLADNPRAGRAITESTRRYSVPRTPFAIVYGIAGDRIEVLRLLDGRADRGGLDNPDKGLQQE